MTPKERRLWLMNLTENEADSLSRIDWYDRTRFLREEIGRRGVIQYRTIPTPIPEKKNATQAKDVPFKRQYKNWMD